MGKNLVQRLTLKKWKMILFLNKKKRSKIIKKQQLFWIRVNTFPKMLFCEISKFLRKRQILKSWWMTKLRKMLKFAHFDILRRADALNYRILRLYCIGWVQNWHFFVSFEHNGPPRQWGFGSECTHFFLSKILKKRLFAVHSYGCFDQKVSWENLGVRQIICLDSVDSNLKKS